MIEALTIDECESLANLIEASLFDVIRNDTEIDSFVWLCNICSAYRKMKERVEVDNG